MSFLLKLLGVRAPEELWSHSPLCLNAERNLLRGNVIDGNLLQYSCLEDPMGAGAW